MPAGTLHTSIQSTSFATTTSPAVIVDPVDLLMVDIATGRYLPGCAVHASQLAHDHGLDVEAARDAIETGWQSGLVTRVAGFDSGVVVWTPEATQVQLHRLARGMAAAATTARDSERVCPSVIDGERQRFDVVDMFHLTTPADVDLFLEIARALLGTLAPALLDELVVPIAVFFSEAAQTVHGLEFAADAPTRELIVCNMVSSLIDGRVDDFADLVADYVVAVSID